MVVLFYFVCLILLMLTEKFSAILVNIMEGDFSVLPDHFVIP